jgi:hypothetical protein
MSDRGTSMAAPHVTGLLAMLMQAPAIVTNYASAINYFSANCLSMPAAAGDPNPGDPNDSWGYGKIRAVCPCCTNPGVTWNNVPQTQPFTADTNFASCVYSVGAGAPQIFMAAGENNGIWTTTNGSAWNNIGPETFGARDNSTLTVFDPGDGMGPRMYLIAGENSAYNYTGNNDVWTSFNGTTWKQVATMPAAFTLRYAHTCLSYAGKLWVIAGFNGNSGPLNDVWSSPDGVNWTEATANAAFPARGFHNSVVFNNEMWVYSGGISDAWWSTDGVNWTAATTSAAFKPRASSSAYVYCGKMWMLGGIENILGANVWYNDVWSSPDGATWTQATANAAFQVREGCGALIFQNIPWVFGGGGKLGVGNLNDVWNSPCSN